MERPKYQRDERSGESGFTLIEMLMVIVILAILASVAVFAVSSMTGTSAQAACKSDFKTVEVAVESYKAQEGLYPTAGQHGVTAPNAVPALLQQDTSFNPPLGPWLRDQPTNGHHYQVEVSTDGKGTVSVFSYNDMTGAAANQFSPTGLGVGSPTNSAADCAKVP